MHRYVWVLVGRLTLALSPHRRLRDRPTTAMRSGPTQGTCLRRTCRFLFFLLGFRSRPSLSSCFSGGPNPPGGLELLHGLLSSLSVSSFFTCITTHKGGSLAGLFIRASDTVGSNPTCRAREALEEGVAWPVACPVAEYVQVPIPTSRASICRGPLNTIVPDGV